MDAPGGGDGSHAGPPVCRTDVRPPPTLEANSPPAAPTGLAATAGDAQVTLTWLAADPNDNVTYYEYNVNHNDTSTGNLSGWSPWTAIEGSGASTTSVTFTGLTNGREYRYHLRAVNDNGESVGAPDFGPPWYVFATPYRLPDAPTGLAAAAGVRSVTLSWNNPGDSSITGYQYNVNHNATSTGNLTGWSPWYTIPDSGASTTSHTFTGLAGGKEYRYHLRAVNAHGPSAGAPASGPPWFVSAIVIAPPPPPAAPTNLRVERVCDHKLKVRWHRSAGAAGYDLEIGSANRKHWKRLLTNWPGNSWFATNWQKDRSYRFAVRAVNDGGASEWVDSALSVAPPCAVNNLRVVTSTPGEGDQGAAGGVIAASWNAGHRANAYHLDYNGTNIVSNHANTSHSWAVDSRGSSDTVSVQSVNGGLTSPSRSASVAWLTASSVAGTTATLNLAGHSGDWHVKKTAPTPAGDCSTAGSGANHNLTGLTPATTQTFTAYADAGCANAMATTTFTTGAGLSVTNIEATSATLNIAGHSGQWWYDADTGPDSACQGPIAAGTSSDNLTGLTEHQQYTYTAYSATGCNSGNALDSITFEPVGDVLEAESITGTTATLKLSNHTGAWWYKRTAPEAGTCTAGDSTDYTSDLTGLTPVTEYTYKSYDVSNCGDPHVGASVTFTTLGLSVSNLNKNIGSAAFLVGVNSGHSQKAALSFRTGNDTGVGSYTLHSVTVLFTGASGSPGNVTVALYAPDTTNTSKPAATAIANATFSGDNPSHSANSTPTYTCAGAGCNFAKGKDYFVVIGTSDTSGSNYYYWRPISSTDETRVPTGNGWSIADTGWYKLGSGDWVGYGNTAAIKVVATENPPATLTASAIGGTGATLTIANHAGAWSYQGISGTEASSTCADVSAGTTTATLTNLTANNLYGYTAYSSAGCTGTEIDTEYFSANNYDVGNLGEGAVASSYCGIGYISSKSRQCAVGFSTGSRSGGYTLKSVTGRFANDIGSPGNIVVKLHAADTGNSSNPAATAIANANFTGNNPSTAGLYGYACAGTGCALSKDTKYFIVMSTGDNSGGNDTYLLETTNSDAEATHPDSNGWTIANVARSKTESNDWGNLGDSSTGLLHLAADE